MRKRVGRQLNKGESLNGLRETVHFAHLGQVRHRQLIDQTAQALCITLVVNCIATFNAGLLYPGVHQLRAAGFPIDDADVSHAGPTMSEHILVHGRYRYDLNRAPQGLRPAPLPQRDCPTTNSPPRTETPVGSEREPEPTR
jgi:hypothetical protein